MMATSKKADSSTSSSSIGDAVEKASPQTTFASQLEPKLSPSRVLTLGTGLVVLGMIGFHEIDGLIVEDAGGSKLINAFYCSVITLTTIGFGDICPGDTGTFGRMFLTVLPMVGIGFFCGPFLELASSWKQQVPGGLTALSSLTLALGVWLFSVLEGMSYSKAIHLSVITGTTIGYGDVTPKSELGRLALAIYAILVVNVVAGFLGPARVYFEAFCRPKGRHTHTQ